MQYKISIQKSQLFGEIPLVFSKSISNRVLIIKSLAEEPFVIQYLSQSNDTTIMQTALNKSCDIIDVEDAGTCMRFLTAYFVYKAKPKILQCSARMKKRPIGILVDALRSLGAKIIYLEKEGYPPLYIEGGILRGGNIELRGDTSSQFITALLLIAPALSNGLIVRLKGQIVSLPYIEMTLRIMHYFGIESEFKNDEIIIKPQQYKSKKFIVEADWSSASYWYSMMALAEKGQILLKNLYKNSTQGDAIQVALFEKLGVKTNFIDDGIILKKGRVRLEKFVYDFSRIPDLAQTFAVCCAFLNIPFVFSGLETLHIKETDRIAALIKELGKFGYQLFSSQKGLLEWKGKKMAAKEKIVVETYLDHRMAMAFAPIIFKMREVYINNPGVVKKSYPSFWEHLKSVGMNNCLQ